MFHNGSFLGLIISDYSKSCNYFKSSFIKSSSFSKSTTFLFYNLIISLSFACNLRSKSDSILVICYPNNLVMSLKLRFSSARISSYSALSAIFFSILYSKFTNFLFWSFDVSRSSYAFSKDSFNFVFCISISFSDSLDLIAASSNLVFYY